MKYQKANQEMTLQEWVETLPTDHRARKELAQLKAENERLRELSLALIENGYMDKHVPDFRVDISYYREFKDEVLIQQQKHDALKESE